jgi:hypothetical protein
MLVCFSDGLFSVGFHFGNRGVELLASLRIAVPKKAALSLNKRDVLLRYVQKPQSKCSTAFAIH